jgi:hypothetical protein
VPTIGGLFWYDAPAALGLTLLQMCSGRMGIHVRIMLALGRLQRISTVRSSTATASSMYLVRLE